MKHCIALIIWFFFCFSSRANPIKELERLACDSVKVFYFNYSNVLPLPNSGRVNDERLVDASQKWASTLTDTGKILSTNDVHTMITILKKAGREKTVSEPVACYIPRMGIAFYAKGLVAAHVDVSLICDRVVLEVFPNRNIKGVSYSWEMLGNKTKEFFSGLCYKYQLSGCSTDIKFN